MRDLAGHPVNQPPSHERQHTIAALRKAFEFWCMPRLMA